MAIVSTELKLYKAATNNDTTSNGGLMTANESVSGVSGNILPDVSEAIRTNGTTAELGGPRYRKVFFKNTNSDAGPASLTNPRIYMNKYTNGGDWVTFFPVTNFNEVASAIAGTEDQYGVCDLQTSITGGTTSTVVVTLEDASNNNIFNNGDVIRLYDTNTTNEEFATVTTAGAPSGTTQTLTCSANITNSYVNTDTIVATVYEHPSPVVASQSVGTPSGSGTLSQVDVNNIGCVEDVWTITFDAADNTKFTVVGNNTGSPTGNVGYTSSNFTLANPNFPGSPYLYIATGYWGGTWAVNDTVQVTTYAAAIPFWIRQEVPAGTAAITSNTFKLIMDGETV